MSEVDDAGRHELDTLAEIVRLITGGDGQGFQRYVVDHDVEPGWLITGLAGVAGQAVSQLRGFGCGPDCPEPPGHEHLVTLEDVGAGMPSIADQLIVRAINNDAQTFTSLLNVVLGGSDQMVGEVISEIAGQIYSAGVAGRLRSDEDWFQKILDSDQVWGRL